jgi:AcrR family transcriptional regulator
VSTRDLWLTEGISVLTQEGPGGVRIDRLAARLGLTKGSFHHHFAGIDGYREALLARIEQAQTDVLDRTAAALADIPPADALRSLPARLDELFDADLDRALRAWAIGDDTAGSVLERLDTARLAFIETLWRRAIGDPTRAATAALLPHLLLIGANAARPPIDEAGRRAVFDLLAELIPSVRSPTAGHADHRPGSQAR